ncbi:hypothetical protein KGF56_002146 [Candida oxycetoniae]|uniref:F-box domain-containing protein n=1 Tax=Candida oxycetoniae TaxID=497107 RepID=A0AAI9WY70_9ASCO|nr:uncharacterized protein KGF56_002146 [Candida oxycetoniae]KAI3405061.2 hypothetical protein KGF56_002146 [Candida oxycetoniae]
MLHQLPEEILKKVGCLLFQDDVVSLMLTCSRFYNLFQPRLYSVICIDATPELFHNDSQSLKEFSHYCNMYKLNGEFIQAVKITSIYSLKAFFKSVENENAQYVNMLMMNKLPDVPDLEMLYYLQKSLPLMSRLQVFEWWHDIDVPLSLLKNNSRLYRIGGFIKSDMNENESFSNLKEMVLTRAVASPPKDLTKLTLRNFDLNTFNFDFGKIRDLTIENCCYKRDYLLKQDLKNIEHFAIDVADDPKLIDLVSTLKLKTLTVKTRTNINKILASNHDVTSLSLSKINIAYLKPLVKFSNLKYLNLSILEKDIFELLPHIPLQVKFISLNVLETTERNNCLLAEEYWQCTTDQNRLKYQDFVLEYHRKINMLNWIMFNGNGKHYVFECNDVSPVIYRDGFESYFEKLVNTLV